jgi:hypothetical protein
METYWAKDFTLSKIPSIEYIKSPRFEAISCAIKINNGPTQMVWAPEVAERLQAIDWANTAVVAHNGNEFDFPILVWRFNCHPKLFIDTAALLRPLRQSDGGVSLKRLSAHYGLPPKKGEILLKTQGKYYEDLTLAEMRDMAQYNRVDTDNCYALLQEIRKHTPLDEFALSDMTARMMCYPQFEADLQLLETTLGETRAAKRAVLEEMKELFEVDTVDEARSQLMSANKFADALRSLGVDPPMKMSKATSKETYALAKTDEAFVELLKHPDPKVQAITAARLDAKSTILETRLETMITCAKAMDGAMPVPLAYHAATTGRWGGRVFNCMTAGHELLTPSGWVDIEEWNADAPVMQWWPDGSLTWCKAASKVSRFESDSLVQIDAPFARGVFTQDHRVVSIRDGRVVERTAGSLLSSSGLDNIPVAGLFSGGTSSLTPAQVRLLVALAADGSDVDGQFTFGFRKLRKIERLHKLLDDVNLKYKHYDYLAREDSPQYRFTVNKSDCHGWVRKGFGPWVLGLSSASMDALLEEIPHWDGMAHSNSGNTCFFSSDLEQAQWVSTVAHLRGTPARIGTRSPRKHDVYFRSTALSSINSGQVTRVDGGCNVYCPQVDSSYVLVRYRGAIHVTGNCQNFPRIPRDKNGDIIPKPTNALRMSLRAPKGKLVVVSDLSGIELRVNHYLWDVKSTQALYDEDPKADLYKEFAASMYGKPKGQVTKDERQLAKVAQLGLGFGAGAATFRRVAKSMGGIDLDEAESARVVAAWRSKYVDIVDGWRKCQELIRAMHIGSRYHPDPRELVVAEKESVRLPSMRRLYYPELRVMPDEEGKKQFVYGSGSTVSKVYSGLMDENLVQAIARDVIAYHALQIQKQTGYLPAHMVHDELVYIAPENAAQALLDEVNKIMRTAPPWLPGIILYSEGDVAESYGSAK